jgi:hypothetical protein
MKQDLRRRVIGLIGAKKSFLHQIAIKMFKSHPGRGRTISRLARGEVPNETPGPGSYDVLHGSLSKRSLNAIAPQQREDA